MIAPAAHATEVRFLLAFAGTGMDDVSAAEAERLLPLVKDWDFQIRLAALHGLLPLLSRHLSGSRFASVVPERPLRLLREAHRTNARRNLFLLREVSRIVLLLEKGGVPVVPFKGPLLAETLYGDISLRQGGDIDLLIRRKDLSRARDLLTAEGYRPYPALTEPAWTTARRKRAYAAYYGTGTVTRDESGIYVDLHWEIASCFFPPVLAGLDYMKNSRRVLLGDIAVPVLAPEDLLVLLAVHGSKHRWERLIWVCDIAEALRKYPVMDWDRVLSASGKVRARRMVLIGAKLAADLLGVHLPRRVTREIDGDRIARMLAQDVCRDLGRADEGRSISSASRKALYHLLSLDRNLDRARYGLLWGVKPNLNDWAWLPLHDRIFPLYYLLRPFRLTIEYGSRALGGRRI